MSLKAPDPVQVSGSPVLRSLADARRRRLLGILLDRGTTVPECILARELAAGEQEESVTTATQEAVRSVRIDLHHVQLPVLEEAELVEWDRDAETVSATAHPAFRDPHLQRILETEAPGLDAVLTALAHPQRRTILSVLAEQDGLVAHAELARAVIARTSGDDFPGDEAEVRIQLRHDHLPKLADAGLVEYDAEAGTVGYEDRSGRAEGVLAFASDGTFQMGLDRR